MKEQPVQHAALTLTLTCSLFVQIQIKCQKPKITWAWARPSRSLGVLPSKTHLACFPECDVSSLCSGGLCLSRFPAEIATFHSPQTVFMSCSDLSNHLKHLLLQKNKNSSFFIIWVSNSIMPQVFQTTSQSDVELSLGLYQSRARTFQRFTAVDGAQAALECCKSRCLCGLLGTSSTVWSPHTAKHFKPLTRVCLPVAFSSSGILCVHLYVYTSLLYFCYSLSYCCSKHSIFHLKK